MTLTEEKKNGKCHGSNSSETNNKNYLFLLHPFFLGCQPELLDASKLFFYFFVHYWLHDSICRIEPPHSTCTHLSLILSQDERYVHATRSNEDNSIVRVYKRCIVTIVYALASSHTTVYCNIRRKREKEQSVMPIGFHFFFLPLRRCCDLSTIQNFASSHRTLESALI